VATFIVTNLTDHVVPLEPGREVLPRRKLCFDKKLAEAGELAQALVERQREGEIEVSVEIAELNLEGL